MKLSEIQIHICDKCSPLDIFTIKDGDPCPFCGEIINARMVEQADTTDLKSVDLNNRESSILSPGTKA